MFEFLSFTSQSQTGSDSSSVIAASEPEIVRRIFAALRPPNDRPHCAAVVAAVCHCVTGFARHIHAPSAALGDLLDDLASLPQRALTPSARALGRRGAHYPAWRAALLIGEDTAPLATEAYGAMLVRALLSDEPISVNAASRVIRAASRSVRGHTDYSELQRQINRSISLVEKGDRAQLLLRDRLRGFYRAILGYTGEHAHQSRPSGRSLRLPRYQLAAKALRQRVEQYDDCAMWQILAILSGLPVDLVAALPVVHSANAETSVPAWLDLDHGTYHLDMAVVAPGARSAPAGPTECVPTSQILVRPLPAFVLNALRAHAHAHPDASTVGNLLNPVSAVQCVDIMADFNGGVRPTLARMQASTEMIARHLGIPSAYAAHLGGRYHSHPSARNYYQLIHTHNLWRAANALFTAIGWGAPVPLPSTRGGSVGAQAVPTDASVIRWHQWMCDEVRRAWPGNRCGPDRLLHFHDVYAHATASIVVFCFALRYVDQIPLSANTDLDAGWTLLQDKRSRTSWNNSSDTALAHYVPLCSLIAKQLNLWRHHCKATAARLRRNDSPPADLLHALNAVGQGKPVAAMVTAAKQQPRVLGSADLTQWWPSDFTHDGNWARSWWTTTFVTEGVDDDLINLLLRHELAGVNRSSSVDDQAQAARLRALRRM